jgi:hypothetical protein
VSSRGLGIVRNFADVTRIVNRLIYGGALPSRYDDVAVPAILAKVGPTRAPTFALFRSDSAASQGVWAYQFDGSAVQEVHFAIQLPHRYAEGTMLYPHVHWAPTNADAGNVVWELEYTLANISGTFGLTALSYCTGTAGVAYQHTLTEFAGITATAATMSALLLGRLARLATAGGDTYSGQAALFSVDLHIEIDEHGSQLKEAKWVTRG